MIGWPQSLHCPQSISEREAIRMYMNNLKRDTALLLQGVKPETFKDLSSPLGQKAFVLSSSVAVLEFLSAALSSLSIQSGIHLQITPDSMRTYVELARFLSRNFVWKEKEIRIALICLIIGALNIIFYFSSHCSISDSMKPIMKKEI